MFFKQSKIRFRIKITHYENMIVEYIVTDSEAGDLVKT